MKKFVIDANVLFSAIISQKSLYIEFINNYEIYAPDFILKEIDKYKDFLLFKIKVEKKESQEFIVELFDQITIIPSFVITQTCRKKAFELCKGIDEKDTPYLALSIQLSIPLLSNDKRLVFKLHERGYKDVILISKFFNEIYRPINMDNKEIKE